MRAAFRFAFFSNFTTDSVIHERHGEVIAKCHTASLWSGSQASSWRTTWTRSRGRCRRLDRKRISSPGNFLCDDACLGSLAYLIKANVVCKATSITQPRLAATLSESMLYAFSLTVLWSLRLTAEGSGNVKRKRWRWRRRASVAVESKDYLTIYRTCEAGLRMAKEKC